MTPDAQREATALLSEIWGLSPDVRLGQLFTHLGFLGEAQLGRGLGYIEDDELIAIMHRHKAELAARLQGTPSQPIPPTGLKMKRDNHVTGNIGLYWTCYQLSRRGWNAMPTSRNARGVDIIAYDRACSKKIAIQVKTKSKGGSIALGNSLDSVMGDFWVIVNDILGDPQAYVLLPSEVKEHADPGSTAGREEGCVSFWLQPRDYCLPEFHEAWHRIEEP
jgi:hypothetical protein